MAESYIFVYHSGEIVNTDEGVTFCSQNPQFIAVRPTINFLELQNIILQKLGEVGNKQITQVIYRVPMAIGKGVLRYRSWQLSNDNDVGLMFNFHAQFEEIRIIELYVVLEDLHFSSGGSAPNPSNISVSQPINSPTFAVASPIQNENIQNEGMDDMMDGPSFRQLAM